MTMIRNNFLDSLTPGLRKDFFDAFGRKESLVEKIYNVGTSNKKSETDSYITGFGILGEKSEGSAIAYDDASQAYDTTYTHVTYGGAYRLTEELIEDELYGMMDKLNTALAIATWARIETDAASLFNNGFSTSWTGKMFSGGDASAMFATDHTLVHGGTEQNTLSTQADLSVTSLQQAFIDIESTVDDRGIPCGLKAKTILAPTALQFTVSELLKSTYVPYSADNEVNAITSKNLNSLIWSYLTDSDAWFILCDMHMLNWLWRRRPSFVRGADFDTGDARYKVTMRYSNGYSDWRGLYGVQGA